MNLVDFLLGASAALAALYGADALELIAGVLTRIGMNLDDIGNS